MKAINLNCYYDVHLDYRVGFVLIGELNTNYYYEFYWCCDYIYWFKRYYEI